MSLENKRVGGWGFTGTRTKGTGTHNKMCTRWEGGGWKWKLERERVETNDPVWK